MHSFAGAKGDSETKYPPAVIAGGVPHHGRSFADDLLRRVLAPGHDIHRAVVRPVRERYGDRESNQTGE